MEQLPSHLYGESIFTTTRTIDSRVLFKDQHIERLLRQVNDYYFLGKKSTDKIASILDIQEKLEQAAIAGANHIIRMMVYAGERETLVPESFSLRDLQLEIHTRPLPAVRFVALKSYQSPFSENFVNIKSGSYFQNFYFKRLAKNEGFSEAIFVSGDLVTEATTANIIFEKNGIFYTSNHTSVFPGLGLEILKAFGLEINYAEININELDHFQSCYLVNSVSPLTPVRQVDSTSFTNSSFEIMMGDLDCFLRSLS